MTRVGHLAGLPGWWDDAALPPSSPTVGAESAGPPGTGHPLPFTTLVRVVELVVALCLSLLNVTDKPPRSLHDSWRIRLPIA